MARGFRSLVNILVVVVLATAGIVRGDVLCFGRDGHVAVEVEGECDDCRDTERTRVSFEASPCTDIPIQSVSASRADSFSPDFAPPVLLAVSVFLTEDSPRPVLAAASNARLPTSSAATRTVILLI